jgi:thiol-disulfide isomerase/thioredoxin
VTTAAPLALVALLFVWTPAGPQQTSRPVSLVSQVRAAITAKDLAKAQSLVEARRAQDGNTSEVLAALSWLARGAQAEGQDDKAVAWAEETQRLAVAALGARPVDADPNLVTAIGAAIEVQAQIAAKRGQRSEAIAFLEGELARYRSTSLLMRLQKNINLLTLEGHPAPPLTRSEWIGRVPPPSLADLKGKVVVLFFWAHWCPDCKTEGPILEKLLEKYGDEGLTIVAPTQRYGYVAGGAKATPEEELQYIVQVRDRVYPWLADLPVPVSTADHERYGVSSTPTIVIVDRNGIIRDYHPGRMTEAELDREIGSLVGGGGGHRDR